MNEEYKKLRESIAKEASQSCHCAGPTCSGCERITELLVKLGFDAAYKIRKEREAVLVEALEKITWIREDMAEGIARAALAKIKEPT